MHEEIVKTCIDAVLTPEQQVRAQVEAVKTQPANEPDPVAFGDLIAGGFDAPLAAVLLTGKKWQPGQVIPIAFMGSDDAINRRVKPYVEEWTRYANLHLDWIGEPEKAFVRISYERGGSWSYIGTDSRVIDKAKQTMNFGWLNRESPEREFGRVGRHEGGHMFGLGHEHGHPEGNIPWNKEAVYREYGGSPNNWSRAQVDAQVFQKYAREQTQFGVYDPTSIMHYPIPNELTTGDFEVGFNAELSPEDIRFMREAYPPEDEYRERIRELRERLERHLDHREKDVSIIEARREHARGHTVTVRRIREQIKRLREREKREV